MKSAHDGSDVTGFGSFDKSTSKRVLDLDLLFETWGGCDRENYSSPVLNEQ